VAFRAGTTSFILLDGVNGSGTNVSRYADNFSWPQSIETAETSVFGTAAKTSIVTLTDGDTISFSGPYDAPIFTQLTGIKAAQSVGSSTSTIVWGPGGSVASEARITAEAWVTQVSLSSTVGGRVEMSASLQVTGAVTNNTW